MESHRKPSSLTVSDLHCGEEMAASSGTDKHPLLPVQPMSLVGVCLDLSMLLYFTGLFSFF